ncbi:MAG: hypothetical protein ACLU8F_03505 [Clostridia bacterium]
MKSDDIRGPLFKVTIAIVSIILVGVLVDFFFNEGLWQYTKEYATVAFENVKNTIFTKKDEVKNKVEEQTKSKENQIVDTSENQAKEQEIWNDVHKPQNEVVEINVTSQENNNISIYE